MVALLEMVEDGGAKVGFSDACGWGSVSTLAADGADSVTTAAGVAVVGFD
jgi:hypothetical protein